MCPYIKTKHNTCWTQKGLKTNTEQHTHCRRSQNTHPQTNPFNYNMRDAGESPNPPPCGHEWYYIRKEAWKMNMRWRTCVFPETLWHICTMTEPEMLNRRQWVREGDEDGDEDTNLCVCVCLCSGCLGGRSHGRVLYSVRHWGSPTVADGVRTRCRRKHTHECTFTQTHD